MNYFIFYRSVFIAYILYWLLASLENYGRLDGEYSGWADMVIHSWSIAGYLILLVSLGLVLFACKYWKIS